MLQLDQLIGELPPVTKCITILSVLIMAAATVDFAEPLDFYLNWSDVFERHQYWRLVTCFLFSGTFNLHWMWNTYVFLNYSKMLEEVSFHERPADFLWMLLSCCSLILLFLPGELFFTGTLLNVITYVWARRAPHAMCRILFFEMKAPYVPYALALMGFLFGGSFITEVVGLFVGHCYYFFTDVYPFLPTSKGFRLFRTPLVLKTILRQSLREKDVDGGQVRE